MVYNVHDTVVGRSLDLYGEYSAGEVELFNRLVEPGQAVVEVGANIGAHTVVLARQVGPTGLVLAIEPQRIPFQLLCANVALNSLTNVICLQQAVGARTGTIHVPPVDFTREGNFGSLSLGSYDRGEQVPLVTLDTFNLARCHFIKIDVEGMEQQVLEGAVGLIERFKPVLYVENDKQDKWQELIRYVDSLGYQMYWHFTSLFSPDNFRGNQENVFGTLGSLSMLCLHRSRPQTVEGLDPVEVP